MLDNQAKGFWSKYGCSMFTFQDLILGVGMLSSSFSLELLTFVPCFNNPIVAKKEGYPPQVQGVDLHHLHHFPTIRKDRNGCNGLDLWLKIHLWKFVFLSFLHISPGVILKLQLSPQIPTRGKTHSETMEIFHHSRLVISRSNHRYIPDARHVCIFFAYITWCRWKMGHMNKRKCIAR